MNMDKKQFLQLLGHLGGDGVHFVTQWDGVISVVDNEGLRKHRKACRKRRYQSKKKALAKATNRPKTVPKSRHDGVWNGITWRDAPGHDETAKKLNFFELVRGKLKGYEHCANLHGDDLRAEFARLNAGQKAKSMIAGAKRTADAQARKAAKEDKT